MASTKKTQGAVTDPAAPPFATRSGAPASPGISGKPTDLTRSATSDNQRGERAPGRDFTKDARSQQPAPDVADPTRGAYPQTPGSPEQRVDPDSIARGGATTKADPGAASRAIGAEGIGARPPFKGMR